MNKKISHLILITTFFLLITSCGKNYNIQDDNRGRIDKNVNIIHVDYPSYDTAQELVSASDLVFSGKPKNIRYEMLNIMTEPSGDSMTGLKNSESLPYTIIEIEINNVYKGEITTDTIEIKIIGGTFGGQIYTVDGYDEILLNNNYLFIANTYPNSYPSLVNLSQSQYNMDTPETLSNSDITISQILSLFN